MLLFILLQGWLHRNPNSVFGFSPTTMYCLAAALGLFVLYILSTLAVFFYAQIFLRPKGKFIEFSGNLFKIKIIDLPPDDKRQRVGQPSRQTPQGSKPTVAQNSPQRAGQSATA
jgi:hypothetical protein